MSNILFCITGPSGSGKTTIMRSIMDNELISFTTRKIREGEANGEDYIFISKEEFDELYDDGMLAEYTEYGSNFYGLTIDELEEKLQLGDAFFICDNNGYNQIKDRYDNIVSIFLYADKEDCISNMRTRGDEQLSITQRLLTYEEEIKNKGKYDYVVKNNKGYQKVTSNIVLGIVGVEHDKNASGVNK